MPNLLTAVRRALLVAGVPRYRRAERDGFDCHWHDHPGGEVAVVWRQVGGKRGPAGFEQQGHELAAAAVVLEVAGFNAGLRPLNGKGRPTVAVYGGGGAHPFRPRRPRKRAAPVPEIAPKIGGAAQ